MINDYTQDPVMRLLVNSTRLAHVSGPALAEAHRAVGRALAPALGRNLVLDDVSIEHVAGTSTGVQMKAGSEPIVVAMLRAGLFVAEGIWSSLPGSSLVLHETGAKLEMPAAHRTIIIVDSVINTGRSLRSVLDRIGELHPGDIRVAALVAFKGNLASLSSDYPGVEFHLARVSERSYVGKGSTDTGSRLYGTTGWGREP